MSYVKKETTNICGTPALAVVWHQMPFFMYIDYPFPSAKEYFVFFCKIYSILSEDHNDMWFVCKQFWKIDENSFWKTKIFAIFNSGAWSL